MYHNKIAGAGRYLALGSFALAGYVGAMPLQAVEERNSLDYNLSETMAYDNNLYRLAPGVDPHLTVGENTEREDFINRASAGAKLHYLAGRQTFDINARADDNRYRRNDILNHVSGDGTAIWHWMLGHDWSGRAGVVYDRALAAFANNRFLGKDLLTSVDYFGEARYELTPRWSFNAGGHWSRADHSTTTREVENQRSKTVNAGVTYETPLLDSFGFDYRYTDTHFPESNKGGGGFDRDYTERAPKGWLKYKLTGKTDLDAQAGFLRRNYPNSVIGNFSGGFWRSTLNWAPSAKTMLSVAAWHELQAYIEAGSDYFVAQGFSLTPAWMPTQKWKFSVVYSRENQRFIGSAPAPFGEPRRRDKVATTTLGASYSPQPWLDLTVSYRFDKRTTNRDLLDYTDDLASVGISLRF